MQYQAGTSNGSRSLLYGSLPKTLFDMTGTDDGANALVSNSLAVWAMRNRRRLDSRDEGKARPSLNPPCY